MEKKHVVIIGGGFAGIYAARALARAAKDTLRITIINRTNHFLFTPMLHEVATGSLGHHQVVESIREIIYGTNIHFIEGSVDSVALASKNVHVGNVIVPYDYLVFAQGSTSHFFHTKGAQEHAFVLKDLSDAISLRNKIIEMFERASLEQNPTVRKQLLSFIIVGGGATGVETAVEIAEFAQRTLAKYYASGCRDTKPTVTLIQSSEELLPAFHASTRARALKVLRKKGIAVRFSTRVKEVTGTYVLIDKEEEIPAGVVVWTAGVKANTIPTSEAQLPVHESGRIHANQNLLVENCTDVFALGDVAYIQIADGRITPMLAQVAIAQAKVLARNILRAIAGKPLKPFQYSSKGELISLGRWEAAGIIFGIPVYGKLAWFIWRTVYLFKFISGPKRLRIAFDWTLQIFYPRDITRV
jgi:NADH dehydrogenase